MVDISTAKNQLNKVDNTLNSMNKITEINSLIDETALNLSSVLWAKNELYIDNDIRNKLIAIQWRLGAWWAWTLVYDIKWKYDIYTHNVETERAAARAPRAEDLLKQSQFWEHLTDPAAWTSTHIARRKTEYDNLVSLANQFILGGNYADQTIDFSASPRTHVSIPLNTFCTTFPVESELCDEDWNPLNKTWANSYEITIDWTTYKLSPVNKVGNSFDFTDMTITPNIADISKPLSLSVTAKYTSTTGIKVACNKKFKLNLSEWWPRNAIARQAEIDAYNSSVPGLRVGTNIVENHLQSRFENEEAQIVRDAIARAVKKINSPVFDSLTDPQKEEFYDRIQRTGTLPDLTHRVGTGGRRELSATLEHWCTYIAFRDWFADDSQSWNKDQNVTRTRNSYRQYFHDHFREESRKYFDSILDKELVKLDNETYLKAQVNRYLVEIDANWRDNDDARSRLETPLARDDVSMEKRRRWQARKWFRNRDDNFMRFFSWSTKEIKNQTVNISTTTPMDPHNIWPINYDMKINVPENNKIWIDIKIQGQEEITLQSWDYDPVTLARRILREPSIPTSKARVHMVYNLYKGLLQLAKEKNIKLEYFDSGSNAMREITLAPNWNIVLNSVVYWTTAPYARTSTTLFDEQIFQNNNQYERLLFRNNSLEQWILGIARHFTYAMNRMDDTYRRSTKRALWRGYRSSARASLPTSFWTSPIRKIINMGNTTNFDFSTSVWETNIELKWNTFTVTTPHCPKPIVSKDLWKILHKRVDKKRIFDWVERDIVEAVYSNLINKMRENSKVARTHFWVLDELTWHVYIIDNTGHFGRINRDALNWRNIFNFWWNDWVISEKVLRWTWGRPWYAYHRLTADEEKELLKNPLLMQWFVKAMNRRMGIVESVRAWFDRH